MPHPQDWQGRQMPRSGPRGDDGHSWIWLMHKRYRETKWPRCGKRKWELTLTIACHMKKGHCYQSITLLGSCARSLFGEPLQFTSGIPRKNSSYLLTKQRPLWLHVSIFTHFNQPLTINNTATVTLPDTKNPHVRMTPRRPSVRYFLSLLLLFFFLYLTCIQFLRKKEFQRLHLLKAQ